MAKYLKAATLILKILTLHPPDETCSRLLKFFFFVWKLLLWVSFFAATIQNFVYFAKKSFDLVEDNKTVMFTGVFVGAAVNLLLFEWKSSELRWIFEEVNETFVDETDNQFEDISMTTISKIGDFLVYYWVITPMLVVATVMSAPIIVGQRFLPTTTWFPYNSTVSPEYEFTYAWQFVTQLVMGAVHGASDTTYFCITALLAQQFKILASNFKYTFHTALFKSGLDKKTILNFDATLSKEPSSQSLREYVDVLATVNSEIFQNINQNILKKHIRHHQILLEFSEKLNKTYGGILLNKLIAGTFYVVFMTFAMITAEDKSIALGLMSYVVAGFLQIVIYTTPAEMLTTWADFSWLMYEKCPWYLCDAQWQTSYLLVQMRSSKPVIIKAGGYFVMSFPFVITYVRGIFSYITLLRKVTDGN